MSKEVSGLTKQNKALIEKIVKKHGTRLDLEAHPELLIEILRSYGPVFYDPDGGSPPGGVGPPGCVVETPGINLDEVMKAILKLSREVAAIKTSVADLKQR